MIRVDGYAWVAPLCWAALVGGWLVVGELLTRLLPAEVSRKIAHVGAAVLAAVSVRLFDYHWYVPLGLSFAVLMLILRRFLPLRALVVRDSWGPVAFGLGGAAAAAIAPNEMAFAACMLILGLADTAAVGGGRTLPIRRVPGGKSVGGALAFAIVTFLVLIFIAGLSWPVALGCAVVLAIAELGTHGGWDNLVIPTLAAALLVVF